MALGPAQAGRDHRSGTSRSDIHKEANVQPIGAWSWENCVDRTVCGRTGGKNVEPSDESIACLAP